uniref:Uncharacterized protein n=1 Tax=Panagrolaimus sp. JU765 TaxID=591449 RepID=A0AC34QM28_9BILA
MKSPGPFIMGWNIQFLGTLPCQKITSESLSRKLDKIVRLNFAPEFVLLSVSLKGVFVASEDDPQVSLNWQLFGPISWPELGNLMA